MASLWERYVEKEEENMGEVGVGWSMPAISMITWKD